MTRLKRFLICFSVILIGVVALVLILFYVLGKTFGFLYDVTTPKDYTYPDEYTKEYIRTNYVLADPNLTYLSLPQACVNGDGESYYAIHNVPLDQYMVSLWDGFIGARDYSPRVKKRNSVDQEPILDWTYDSVQFISYKQVVELMPEDLKTVRQLGKEVYGSTLAKIDATVFRTFLTTALETQSYLEKDALTTPLPEDSYGQMLAIRVNFAEYENLVWDARVITHENVRYLEVYVNQGGSYQPVYIPLPAEIVALIPQ